MDRRGFIGALIAGFVAMAKMTGFTSEGAKRIARTVRKSEGMQSLPPPSRTVRAGETFGRVIVGKTNAAHAKNAAGTINVWDGTQGSETATGDTLSAWNYFAAISSGKWVAVVETVRGYVVISAECA